MAGPFADPSIDDLFSTVFASEPMPTPPPTWHLVKWKERASKAQQTLLDHLKRAYPEGLGTRDLIETHGPSAQARVGELLDYGWKIRTHEGADGLAMYRLEELEQGDPPPNRAPRVSGGRWTVLEDGTISVSAFKPRQVDRATWNETQAGRDAETVARVLRGGSHYGP